MKDRKLKFLITFNPDHYILDGDNEKLVGTTFFSDERGYSTGDLGKIVMLEIGQQILMDEGSQTIERVQ